jgi:hypothetical protein
MCCFDLKEFKVPESVEILGDSCFEACFDMERIEFEGSSRLKRIGERAFMQCPLHSITIPALTEEIDGSVFVDCPFISIQVAPENVNFKIEGSQLVTSNGTEIVRYFGLDREIVIGRQVKVLGKSCFEGCDHLDNIYFEPGSELERIDRSALRRCVSLESIEIPGSVTIIGENSFEGCSELETCLIAEDSSLVAIGGRAFAECTSLKSFSIPGLVAVIGGNCFSECNHLYRLKFGSSTFLKTVVGDRSLDDALYDFGVSINSSLFGLDIVDGGLELNFPGWISVHDGDGNLHLSLV